MGFQVECFIHKGRPPRRRLIVLLCFVVFGLLMMSLFSGKSRIDLETIAVSPDEQYIACFETGRGHKIRCFCSDGSLAFDYEILPDVSGGGYCTLWFEDDVLCVLFYRTDKIAYFSMDGTILKITDHITEDRPPEFPSFVREGHQFVFAGNAIDVIYEKGSFFGYWFFGSDRYLAIKSHSGEMKVVYSWTAKESIVEKAD